MKRTEKKGWVRFFIAITAIIIIAHTVLLIFAHNIEQILYSVIPLAIIAFQTYRVYSNKIEYKGWSNCEIKPTTQAFMVIGVPLPYFGYNILTEIGRWRWISIILFVIFIAYMAIQFKKIYSLKSSFSTSKYTVDDLKKIFQKNDVEFKKINKETSINTNFDGTMFYLPRFGCRIFENKQGVIISPTKSNSKHKVFSIIDMIEQ